MVVTGFFAQCPLNAEMFLHPLEQIQLHYDAFVVMSENKSLHNSSVKQNAVQLTLDIVYL